MKIDLTKTNGSSPPVQLSAQPNAAQTPLVEREEIWTVAETAKYLKLSPRQVWELTRRRSQARSEHPIPFIRIHSKCLRFRKTNVLQWLVALTQKARL